MGAECNSMVKTAQDSKIADEIERKISENVKLKEEDVPGAILPREKPEECTVKQLQRWLLCRGAKRPERKCSSCKGTLTGLSSISVFKHVCYF